MKVVFFGPPGSGKGTQAIKFAQRFRNPHLSTGDILRKAIEEGTETGLKAKSLMDAGQLIPDSDIVAIVRDRISQSDCQSGFILDGFPRTLEQAHDLERFLKGHSEELDYVFEFKVPTELLIERITGRFSCKKCGAAYHPTMNPTKVADVCDRCGSSDFMKREDDTLDTVKGRIAVYEGQAQPLLSYYSRLGVCASIDAVGSVEEVFNRVIKSIEK